MVLLDLDELDVNGLDLARQIKLEAADVPVVLLSTAGDQDIVVKGLRTGSNLLMVKPNIVHHRHQGPAEGRLLAPRVTPHPSSFFRAATARVEPRKKGT